MHGAGACSTANAGPGICHSAIRDRASSRTTAQMHVPDAEQIEVDSTSRFKDKSPFVPVTILTLSSVKMPHPAATSCLEI